MLIYTRKNPSLTSQRWGEAMRGGYSMPSFAVGGKFDTKAYMKGAQRTNHIKLGDNKYYVRYAYAGVSNGTTNAPPPANPFIPTHSVP